MSTINIKDRKLKTLIIVIAIMLIVLCVGRAILNKLHAEGYEVAFLDYKASDMDKKIDYKTLSKEEKIKYFLDKIEK